MLIAVFIKSGDGRGEGARVPFYRVHFHKPSACLQMIAVPRYTTVPGIESLYTAAVQWEHVVGRTSGCVSHKEGYHDSV